MPTKTLGVLPAPVAAPVDDELSRARVALSLSNIYVLRKLQIDRDGEALVMRGRVDSYYHKQLAQELVKAAVEGTKVINALQVVYTPKTDYFTESR
jgi:hypothetical protein